METPLSEFYEFGNFRFNPAERSLVLNGESIALTPRALDTLFALVSRSGHLVTKEELLKEVWQDAFVEEATVVQNISTLRKVLSRDDPEKRFIETVPKRGYRFVAKVEMHQDERISQAVSERVISDIGPVAGGNGNGAGVRLKSEKPGLETSGFPTTAFGDIRQVTGQTRETFTWKQSAYLVVGMFALLASGLFLARIVRQNRVPSNGPSFEKMSLARISQSGKARNSAISPDGNYVAYVALDAGKQSLWIRQVGAPNDAQITSPLEVQYLGPTFSPDGNSVLFVTYEKGKNEGVLYRVPVIGGVPQRVMNDVDSPVTFSPDGKQFAFVRGYPIDRETALMIANADGTSEQKLASRIFPAFFSWQGPTWSPNGTVIACGIRDADPHQGVSQTVVGVEVTSRQEKFLTQQRWAAVGRLSWDKSGERIILTAAQEFLGPHQLWQISWPSGSAHRITNDLTDYRGVSVTPDKSVLSTVATEANSTIWLTTGPQYLATQLASTRNDGLGGIAWTPDNQLVFTEGVGTQADIWILDTERGLKKALTSDNRRDFAPVVTRDGRFLIYSSEQEGSPARVWRTNIDGSNPKQLTNGNDDRFPACSVDGKWVFYSSFIPNQQERYDEKVWRVPLDGGESTLVVDQPSTRPLVSPDGKLVSFAYQPAPDLPWKVRIISYETGEVVKDLPVALPALSSLQWSPDGRGLTYVETADGISNIWLLPLSGRAPKQITHFNTAQIFSYAWSHDGKRLAMVRGVQNGDVVLIRNFG